MAPNPVNHDPALSHTATAPPPPQPNQPIPGVPHPMLPPDLANLPLQGLNQLDPNQLINLIKNLPGVFSKLTDPGQSKEDAAQALSNLSQAPAPFQPAPGHPFPGQQGMPGINDPGPSSHPRGPPGLGQLSQLSALAMSAAPPSGQRPGMVPGQPSEMEEPSEEELQQNGAQPGPDGGSPSATTPARRGGRSATMGSDEWARQRKDNHKEVERRRRGNINDGINELGRIVPNGSGEKSKGAILSRAVQYIHHLKENEARNIEKWTLEKLLMDQAMGDLQTQLEELKKAWDAERNEKMRLSMELEVYRNQQRLDAAAVAALGNAASAANAQQRSPTNTSPDGESLKRSADGAPEEGDDKEGKRQRTE